MPDTSQPWSYVRPSQAGWYWWQDTPYSGDAIVVDLFTFQNGVGETIWAWRDLIKPTRLYSERNYTADNIGRWSGPLFIAPDSDEPWPDPAPEPRTFGIPE